MDLFDYMREQDMKKALNVITGAAFLAALGIVGAVERGGDISLMWWTLPCFIVMGIAAYIAESEETKKIIREVVLKSEKR